MSRGVAIALVLAGALAAPLVPRDAPAASEATFELVSRPSGFGALPFDGVRAANVGRRSLSADGCFVAITSDNDVLSSADDDEHSDVFRVDRCSPGRPTVLASARSDGTPADGAAFWPTISADGRFVAFSTTARNLLPPGTTVPYAVVVKDLQDGSVEVASRGHGANSDVAEAFTGVISGDGSAVAFESRSAVDAANAQGTKGSEQLYVRRMASFSTHMTSVKSDGTPGGSSGGFDISHDGGSVALTSTGALVAADVDGSDDVYLARNVSTPPVQQQFVSFTSGNTSGAQSGRTAAVSGDGQRVAFANERVWIATCAPTCGSSDPVDGFTAPATPPTNAVVGFPAGAGAPAHVFWTTNRPALPADTDTDFDLYLRDLSNLISDATMSMPAAAVAGRVSQADVLPGVVTVLSAQDAGLPGTDGYRTQAFALAGGQATLLSQPAGVPPRRGEVDDSYFDGSHAVAAGGRAVAFTAYSQALGAPVTANGMQETIAVRQVAAGTTTVASTGTAGEPANDHAYSASIDAAGSRAAFESQATNLVAQATNGKAHLYVRDLATGTTQVADRDGTGAPASGGINSGHIAPGGTVAAFTSRSPDLPGADGDTHVYVVELATGATVLADQTPAGVVANRGVETVDVSADGTRVAFVSNASNLGTGGAMRRRAFVKDLVTGALIWASVPEGGDPDRQNASDVSISGDGSRVAFVDSAPDLGYGSDGRPHVYVRDLAAATTTLASVGGGGGPLAQQHDPVLDHDGDRLVFREFEPGSSGTAHVRDLGASTTTTILPGVARGVFDATLDPEGRCAAITAFPQGIPGAPATLSPDFSHVWLHALSGDCPVAAPVDPVPGDPEPPGGGPALDTTAPALTDVRLTRKRFAPARRRARSARTVPRGTEFRFTLSEDARTSIAIARARPGRRKGGSCVKPRPALRARGKCKRFVVLATLTRTKTTAGRNRVAFSGRLGKRPLKPGRHRAVLGAVDAAGNPSEPHPLGFRIVRAKKR